MRPFLALIVVLAVLGLVDPVSGQGPAFYDGKTMAHYAGAYSRPFYLPPGVPKERVRILRTAFEETLKDKAFLAVLYK